MPRREPPQPHVAPVCDSCGERHQRMHGGKMVRTCTAHTTDGTACMKHPLSGAKVCATHGVNARTRAAAKRAKEAEFTNRRAAAILANIQPNPMHSDPLRGLLWEVQMSANAVEWYAERLAELGVPVPNGLEPGFETEGPREPSAEERAEPGGNGPLEGVHLDRAGRPIWGRQEADMIWGYDSDGDQAAHILLQLWNEERDRHAVLCERAIRAGVQERLGALMDTYAAGIKNVIDYVIESMGWDAATREHARQLAAGRMRAMPPITVDSRLTLQ